MYKCWIIASRECAVRMRKPGFWLLALVGPFVLLLLSIVPYALTSGKNAAGMLINLPEASQLEVPLTIGTYETQTIRGSSEDAYLRFLSGDEQVLCDWNGAQKSWTVFRKGSWHPADSLNTIRTLQAFNASEPAAWHVVSLNTEEESYSSLQHTVALLAAILVYFFLFTYSVALLKGVMEEKSSKVMDLILSSVSPVVWIGGKIMGVGLASLVQFVLWLGISYVPFYVFKKKYANALDLFSPEHLHETLRQTNDAAQALGWYDWVTVMAQMPWWTVVLVMFLSMLCGFVLYAAVFAVIGMLAGRESDAQPYVLPVTSPLIFSFLVSGLVIAEPYGSLATWLSAVPFTAPVALTLRAGLGVTWHEMIGSMASLLLFAGMAVMVAGRLYKRILNNGGKLV